MIVEDLDLTGLSKSVTFDMSKLKHWKKFVGRETPRKPKWIDLFKVEAYEEEIDDGPAGWTLWGMGKRHTKTVHGYLVRNVKTQEVVGKYQDYDYARSRCRYFYKRYMHKVEKILLSG